MNIDINIDDSGEIVASIDSPNGSEVIVKFKDDKAIIFHQGRTIILDENSNKIVVN